MAILEQLEYKVARQNNSLAVLAQGSKAKIKQTGQIVEIKKFSEYGLSIVAFRTGGEYYVANKDLEQVGGEESQVEFIFFAIQIKPKLVGRKKVMF